MPDEPEPRVAVVWTLAQSQLEAQKTTVDELRARVGILISGAAIATGFLAGQALNTKHGIPAGAWLGIVAAFLFLVACGIILLPRKWSVPAPVAQLAVERRKRPRPRSAEHLVGGLDLSQHSRGPAGGLCTRGRVHFKHAQRAEKRAV